MKQPEPGPPPAPLDAFERGLTRALRRVDAPEDFARSVLLAAAAADTAAARERDNGSQPQRQRISGGGNRASGSGAWPLFRAPVWASGVLAAMLLLGAWAGEQVHARHQRQQARIAQQQFETALRVTDQALDQTRRQLARAGLRLP